MVDPARPPAGRLVRLGVVLRGTDPVAVHRLARMCDLAGIDVIWAADDHQAVEVGALVRTAQVLTRPAVDEAWARTLPVSIGRTPAEAEARAAMDPGLADFGGAAVGLFGTVESAHARVAALAHAGVTDLRCVLPDLADVHDVVAQLTAAVVGTPGTHRPGAARSPDPDPPPWAARRRRS
ncbi:MAG TPA: hypothetical protein VFP08_00950 [Acidimicrobiales bacterium]|nr:hypothetical protein [Acidimicrobiales bacterium]